MSAQWRAVRGTFLLKQDTVQTKLCDGPSCLGAQSILRFPCVAFWLKAARMGREESKVDGGRAGGELDGGTG